MMNTSQKLIALLSGAALLSVSSLAAQTATTTPVGYVSVTVNGTGGVASEAFTYMGVPLHAAAATQANATSAGANTITSAGAGWDVDAYAGNYVQILSGANTGVSATIASNTADTLTTVEDLDSLLSGDEAYAVYPYTTLADVFGAANEVGLDGGSASGNADNILVQNGSAFDTYYFKDSGLGGTGWRSSTSPSVDASGTAIPYGVGVIVVRRQAADLELVVAGTVFSSDAITPVEVGFNWKTASIPVEITLAGLFGASNEAGLDGGSASGNADNILVFQSSGDFNTYYYKESGLGGTGWRSSTSPSVDEANASIAPGEMFIINRSGGAGFNLTEVSPL